MCHRTSQEGKYSISSICPFCHAALHFHALGGFYSLLWEGWWELLDGGYGSARGCLPGVLRAPLYPAEWGDFPSLGDTLPVVGHRTGTWSGLVPPGALAWADSAFKVNSGVWSNCCFEGSFTFLTACGSACPLPFCSSPNAGKALTESSSQVVFIFPLMLLLCWQFQLQMLCLTFSKGAW